MDYKFTSEKFAINDEGFHLLRNRFNYKSYKISDLTDIRIAKGNDLKNWLFVLCFGLLLVGFAIYDSIKIWYIFRNPEGVIYIERLLIPIFPLALGLYSLIISLRKSTIMRLMIAQKRFYFSLRQQDKAGQTDELIKYLKELNLRPRIDI